MKISIAVVFFTLFSSLAHAQNYPKAKVFINEIIAEQNRQDSIQNERLNHIFKRKYVYTKPDCIYQDSVGKMAINTIMAGMERAKSNKFYIFRRDSVMLIEDQHNKTIIKNDYGVKGRKIEQIASDSLVLSEKERAYIDDQINKMAKHSWEKKLLPDFTFLPTDTIRKMSAQRTRDIWDCFQSKRIYSFSVPMFLRNDTYCFFYCDYGCGIDCGGGNFVIYKKENGKWEIWLSLSGWIS